MVRDICLGIRLGLFQLSLGILGVLMLGLFNRLLIEEIGLPAAVVALAIGSQQLMGFTRIWFGNRSDRIAAGRLKRTPYIVISALAFSGLFGLSGWVVLQLARTITLPGQLFVGPWVGLLMLISIALGMAISAGGTAFSALVVDLTCERERPRVLAVVWGMRLLGVLLGSAFVARLFGAACEEGASADALKTGLEQLILVGPLLLFGLVVFSVLGLEHRLVERDSMAQSLNADVANNPQKNVPLLQLLGRLRTIPQFGRFVAVTCLFTFSMFLNDAVLESYGAALFGMSLCATTALNALMAIGFFVGLGVSGFLLIERIGNIRTAQLGGILASMALVLMLLSAPWQFLGGFRLAVMLFGLSLGICIHASFTLMFSFVEPGKVGLLLGIWGALYAYSRGLATISGGGLLTLFKTLNPDDVFGSFGSVFGVQIVGFLVAAVLMHRLDVDGFRKNIRQRFGGLA
ncbi:light-harvesting 1 (B870) complex assembly protein PucC-like [Synechococcus sp. BL107]|uniref:BCD family MFS transporter n=1 Tax=Synechococcus sp. BL107 TaxID=313625 RepID=UPI0000E53ECC|nr:BCD family MFS transporter [Synechococcus sp. BL107]EAU70191.1 light-harvesting 1 (B870) complex assembly protein PucC-like [Synechococcus sp. BL107]